MDERRRGGLRATAFLALVLALTFTSSSAPARAHVGHVIARAERYLKLDATDADTRLVVSLMLGPEEGARVLAAADADEDRRVTPSEAEAYLAQWAAGLRDELPLTIDGRAATLEWTDGWLDPIGRVRPVALTVELVAHLPPGPREQHLVLEDRMVRRETFDRTDVAFRAHDGAELVACGPLAEPLDCATPDLAIVGGSGPPTVFGARVRYPGRPETTLPVLPALGALGTLLCLGAAALMVRRRRRAAR